MRRFDYDDNEENQEDVDNFFDNNDGGQGEYVTPEEYKILVQEEHQIQQVHLHLLGRELNDRLLFRVVRMLEKNFWWRFYSINTRLKMIEKAFKYIKSISEKEL